MGLGDRAGLAQCLGQGMFDNGGAGFKAGFKTGFKADLGLARAVGGGFPGTSSTSPSLRWLELGLELIFSFGGGFWRSISSFQRDLQRLIFGFGGGFGNPSVCVGLSPTPHRGVGRFPRSRVRALVLQPHGKADLFPKNSQNCWAHPTPAHHLSDEPKSSALELISSFGGGLWRFFFSFRGICRDWSPNVEEVLEICDLAKPSPTQE